MRLQQLLSLVRRRQFEHELDEEMQYHLDREIQQQIVNGLTPEEARRTALRVFNGIEQRKEECRDTRRIAFIDNLVKDLRYAARMMRNSPGFTITAVLTIALGIGVNTTVFSAYNAVALKPLPIAEPDSVVRLKRWFERSQGDFQYFFSFPEYVYSRDHNTAFASLVANSSLVPVIATENGGSSPAEPETVQAQLVSANYFSALGIAAQLGRMFLPDEDRAPGANPVVVLSHAFWRRRFHSDPQTVGKTIRTRDAILTVIGVAPEEFTGTSIIPQIPDFWAPLSMQAQLAPGRHWLNEPDSHQFQILGRLQPATTLKAAQPQVDTMIRQFAETYTVREKTVSVTLEHTSLLGNMDDVGVRAVVGGLMLVVGLILLVACANVANMLLARGETRRREISIRLAIGASRGRVVRQLLTESLLLSMVGGLTGLVLSAWASQVLWNGVRQIFAGPMIENLIDVNLKPDLRVFAYALGLSVATGMVFGLSPALQATKSGLISVIKGEGSLLGRWRRPRLRSILIATQVTISVLFLFVGGLLVRGLVHSQSTDVGFDARSVYVLAADFGNDRTRAIALQRRLLQELQTLPELKGAALGYGPFFGTWTPRIILDSPKPSGQVISDQTLASYASDSYFDTLGIAIVHGRRFTKKEADEGAPFAIVSQATARRFWPGQDPLQKRFGLVSDFSGTVTNFEVIGVTKDVRFANPTRIDPAHVYLATKPGIPSGLLFRVQGKPQVALASVRQTVQVIDPDLLPNLAMINLEVPLHLQISLRRGLTFFVIFLAIIALSIASTGIYGVMGYIVNQRVKEIGIRVALGATQHSVMRTVLVTGLKPMFIGLLIGIAGSFAVSSLLHRMLASPGSSDFLNGVPFYDPLTFLGLSCFVLLIAALASLVPARRALRVDPMIALRFE